MSDSVDDLLDFCKALLSAPPEVQQAIIQLERKRILRENMETLIAHADDVRKRKLEEGR